MATSKESSPFRFAKNIVYYIEAHCHGFRVMQQFQQVLVAEPRLLGHRAEMHAASCPSLLKPPGWLQVNRNSKRLHAELRSELQGNVTSAGAFCLMDKTSPFVESEAWDRATRFQRCMYTVQPFEGRDAEATWRSSAQLSLQEIKARCTEPISDCTCSLCVGPNSHSLCPPRDHGTKL